MEYKTSLAALLEASRESFAQERFLPFDQNEFVSLGRRTQAGVVDLRRVVGLSHSSYFGRTWLELLVAPDKLAKGEIAMGELPRLERNLKELAQNPEYFLDDSPKEHWTFAKVGASYYVDGGCHRTVLSRFFFACNGLPPIVRGVAVSEYSPILHQATMQFEPAKAPDGLLQRLLGIFKG